jgi:phosphopantothenoylcysteine decarboxylase/phosphopantothenate--cysteine ligase
VTLVHSITGELPLSGVRAIAVASAQEMRQAMLQCFHDVDLTVMAAAVADVRPAEKLPKRSLPNCLPLAPVADIVAELGKLKQPHQKLIGFAAQSGDIVKPALEKLRAKKLDVIAANPIDQIGAGFGSNTNQAILINAAGKQVEIAPCSKLEMAHRLLDFVMEG